MRRIFHVLACSLFLPALSFSQSTDSLPEKVKWEGSISANNYFFRDDFLFNPVITGDHNRLHLEGRYNYESENSGSFWTGYNFSGGNKLEYFITPMAGLVVGDFYGVAPGLEMTFTLGKFELYTESEYLFDFNDTDAEDFFYNWSDLSFSFYDHFKAGLSGQRTRIAESDLEIQRGVFLGGSIRNLDLSVYYFNPGTDDNYVMAAIAFNF